MTIYRPHFIINIMERVEGAANGEVRGRGAWLMSFALLLSALALMLVHLSQEVLQK